MPDFQPEPFGRYYLIDRIAVGGMAEIFRAKSFSDAGFEKLQVIKRILSHLSENQDFVDMFIDEAKISVELQHANIVQIYDFGKIGTHYYIAMELVDGKDVKQILRKLAERRKLLPEEFAVYIAHEVCQGLAHAHAKTNLLGEPLNIVHRDVSPSNVLVSYAGEVKIADFGIAKAARRIHTTDGGMLKGKFEYMSPEQARGEPLTHSSDIFSTGIILWEMLTGRRLFKTDSEVRTLEKIKALDIPPPSSRNPNISPRLDAIVLKALAGDPADRYPDARAFQSALLDYMYPSTPTVVARSLGRFMEELFAEEREQERSSLERGTAIALQLHSQAPELELDTEWSDGEEGPTPTLSASRPRSSLLLAVLVVLLFATVGLLLWQRQAAEPPPVAEPAPAPAPAPPSTGQLVVRVDPPGARVMRGDEVLGTGPVLEIADLPPGPIALRLEAEGYQPQQVEVEVGAGSRTVVPVRLQPEPASTVAAPPPPAPRASPSPPPAPPAAATEPPSEAPAPAAPPVRFRSSPAGADVFIDNRLVGRTPTTWTGGVPGSRHELLVRREGYEDHAATLTVPTDPAGATVSVELRPRKAKPGKVNVNVTTGWAYVWVDGQKLQDTTPLFGYELPPGRHVIRVARPEIGLDETRTVVVRPGEVTRVTFGKDD